MGLLEKIRELEEELKRTDKNKATEKHIGLLKAKIARLRRSLITSGGGGRGGFAVRKSGDATVAIIGFPSVGKSTILSKITNAESKSEEYAFTTLSCIPGVLFHKGARIQLLDLPGILDGASSGKGRGKEVISVARNSDLILIVVDAQAPTQYFTILKELNEMGIKLNEKKPDVVVKKLPKGGITINSTVKLTEISEETIKSILHEYKIHNAEVVFRENVNAEQFIDVLEGNRVYLPALVVVNKIELVDEKEIRKVLPVEFIPISAQQNINLDVLKDEIYHKLNFIRVYMKPRNREVDKEEPLIIRKGSTIEDVCRRLHKRFLKDFKYALVWGKSVKYRGQRVGLNHKIEDGDIITIITK